MDEIVPSVWPSPKSSSITPSKIPEPVPVKVTTSGAVPDVGDASRLLFEFGCAVIIIVTMPRVVAAAANRDRCLAMVRTS